MPRRSRSIDRLVRARVREHRVAKGFTQEKLCERAGISIDAVNRIENGTRTPTLSTLVRIADALGIGVGELLESTPPTTTQSPALQRLVAELSDQPEHIQNAAEQLVRVLLTAARR